MDVAFSRQLTCHLRKLERPAEPGMEEALTVTVGLRQGEPGEVYLAIGSEADLFFYYEAAVTQADFPALREEQGFMFEFSQLQAFLVKLLTDCERDPRSCMLTLLLSSDGTKGRVAFVSNIFSFKYVEICRLELRAGDPDVIKANITDRYNALRVSNVEMAAQVAELKRIIRARLPNVKLPDDK